jgi:hypothetical protein
VHKKQKPRELTEAEKEFLAKVEELIDESIEAGTFTEKKMNFVLNTMKLLLNPDTTTVVDIEKVNSKHREGTDELYIKIPIPKK